MKRCALIQLILIVCPVLVAADTASYFGKDIDFDPNIPRPEAILGYRVGDWHVRHDQLVTYMHALAKASDRVTIEQIGTTHEQRPLLHLTISTPENLARIDEIREEHLALAKGTSGDPATAPVVIWMGYSVHGNEPSGANASLLVAYYLAAARGIEDQLGSAIVIMDPSLNPDGLARFAQWANMHKGNVLVADGDHREHTEGWPSGRTNHYWFDLNRDWLLLQHPESRARIARFHQWMPNILTDHHEMGTGSTFFFQPGIPSRKNPLTPDENVRLTETIATYHAAAFDRRGELYYSEQSFDDFYYGKGSTYPDIHGSIGILFEQASSRGHLQENDYGELTFPHTIENQVETSLSTLKAGIENREKLLSYQKSFYPSALEEARKDKVKAYVFGTPGDLARANEMARILMSHQIRVHPLERPVELASGTLDQGFVVPTEQRQYRLIRSLFEKVTSFEDNTFYDVSTWHFPSLFWADYGPLEGRAFSDDLIGDALIEPPSVPGSAALAEDTYAYIIPWSDYFAASTAYALTAEGVRVRYASSEFRAEVGGEIMSFDRGTLLVPMGVQEVETAEIHALLEGAAERDGVRIYRTTTGLTPNSPDLGGPDFETLEKPRIMLVAGSGTSAYEVGEIWYLLDHRLKIPVTLVEQNRLPRADLESYTHLVMVAGGYDFPKSQLDRIKSWIRGGGTLIATRSAVRAVCIRWRPGSLTGSGERRRWVAPPCKRDNTFPRSTAILT